MYLEIRGCRYFFLYLSLSLSLFSIRSTIVRNIWKLNLYYVRTQSTAQHFVYSKINIQHCKWNYSSIFSTHEWNSNRAPKSRILFCFAFLSSFYGKYCDAWVLPTKEKKKIIQPSSLLIVSGMLNTIGVHAKLRTLLLLCSVNKECKLI